MELEPNNIKTVTDKGLALASIYKYEDSLDCFDQALKLNPNNAEIWYRKGLVLGKNKKFSEAEEHFDQALKLDPDFEPAQKAKTIFLTEF